jgi:hypothetical protein
MDILWAILLILLNTVWLALTVLGLPGNWLIVISAALVVWRQWGAADAGGIEMFTIWTLLAVIVVAAIAELAEILTGVFGSTQMGGTRRGSLGALLGGLIGAIIGTPLMPILGTLLGACLGAALGAWGFELSAGRKMIESARAGLGAGLGTLAGRLIKTIAGVLIWLTIAVAAFWP